MLPPTLTPTDLILHPTGEIQIESHTLPLLSFGAARELYTLALRITTLDACAAWHLRLMELGNCPISEDDAPAWFASAQHVSSIMHHIMYVPLGPWSGVSRGGAPKPINPAVINFEVGMMFGPIYKALAQAGVPPSGVDAALVWQVAWMCGVDEMPNEEEMAEIRKHEGKERLRSLLASRLAGEEITHATGISYRDPRMMTDLNDD